MMKRTWRRIALAGLSVVGLLILVLAVHIYIVTRPGPAGADTRAMARIDILQPITRTDADKITVWLYRQKGVDHVLVNPQSNIAVFSFFPVRTTADQVVSAFKAHLPYKAERFIPSGEALKSGCPVASSSTTYKIYSWLKRIF
jgi:hypothetical protein